MVDVGGKTPTRRRAVVCGTLTMSADTFALICQRRVPKGDPFTIATIAGIQAAKRTAELIPLCHPIPLDHVHLTWTPDTAGHRMHVTAETLTTAKTGIEMEAFVAASIALVTLYDMIKSGDPSATITDLRLVHKSGGRHGFQRTEDA